MSSSVRFKPYAPDVQAAVRMEEALPPEHPTHVFVDLVRGVELRLAKIQAAREHLEAEQRSFADTDARIMLMKRGAYDYAYNAQAAVDAESGVIVAATLTNVAPDMRHLPDLVADVRNLRAGLGLPATHPTTVTADAGYFSGENAAEDGAGLDLLIAAGRDDPAAAATKTTGYSIDRFGYDPTRDVWVCPAEKLLRLMPSAGQRSRPSVNQYLAAAADCSDCRSAPPASSPATTTDCCKPRTADPPVRCASSSVTRTPACATLTARPSSRRSSANSRRHAGSLSGCRLRTCVHEQDEEVQ